MWGMKRERERKREQEGGRDGKGIGGGKRKGWTRREDCLGIQAYGGRIPPAERPRPHHSLLELHQAAALGKNQMKQHKIGVLTALMINGNKVGVGNTFTHRKITKIDQYVP